MSAKWTSKPIPEESQAKKMSMDEQFVVLLMYGKNSFGDKIYSYLKISLPNLPRLKSAIKAGKGFNPSDFGEVIAAGKNEPTTDVRAEIANAYQVLDSSPAAQAAVPAQPAPKKAWDEY
ncbi:MAG: hypothetical protein AB7L92_01220 [Alphaproteobacteria bacterium]